MAKKNNPMPYIFVGGVILGAGLYFMTRGSKKKEDAEKLSFPKLEDQGTYTVGEEIEVERLAYDGESDASDYLDMFEMTGPPDSRLRAATYEDSSGEYVLITAIFNVGFENKDITIRRIYNNDPSDYADMIFTNVSAR